MSKIYNIIKLFLIAGYKNACIVFLFFYRSVSHVCPNKLHIAFNETSNHFLKRFTDVYTNNVTHTELGQ